jgi:hypothetical protein
MSKAMRRSIRKRIRRTGDGVDLVADINAEIAINVNRRTVPVDAKPAEPGTGPDRPPTGGTATDERQTHGNDPEGKVR